VTRHVTRFLHHFGAFPRNRDSPSDRLARRIHDRNRLIEGPLTRLTEQELRRVERSLVAVLGLLGRGV
jgi:hypothetical protein